MFTGQTEIYKIIRFVKYVNTAKIVFQSLSFAVCDVWQQQSFACEGAFVERKMSLLNCPTIKNLNICSSRFNSFLYTPLTPHTSELKRRNISKAKFL